MNKQRQPATRPNMLQHVSRLRRRIASGGAIIALLLILAACERPDPNQATAVVPETTAPPAITVTPDSIGLGITAVEPATPLPAYEGVPTPDSPHPTVGSGADNVIIHSVASGETLGYIAQQYGLTLDEIVAANDLAAADFLQVGQEIRIPDTPAQPGPDFKIIPDSELVFGPAAKGFRARDFVAPRNSYLLQYEEDVEGQRVAGPEIVDLVAHRFSVNPRVLLALLDYWGGWISQTEGVPVDLILNYSADAPHTLYDQLGAAANQLNWGYYGRNEANQLAFTLSDGAKIAYAAEINDGTAGVQRMLGRHTLANLTNWQKDAGPDGYAATFNRLFGNPFAYTVEPLIPPGLQQPPMQLPWQKGETWYYSSGPHGGWAPGSAWAALDFAPPEMEIGCAPSDSWVTAVSDGVVTRSGFGAVVVDMDGDNYAGTGWAVAYMHLDNRDRIPVGSPVQTGDRLGHPGCEGGFSDADHVHLTRTYNGRWISADGTLPFDLGGWVSQGAGREYDGFLTRGNVSKEACACWEELNAIPNE
ncbi:MAG TPA: LysM peptidoglycan-binding domain-containing protein [Anaerolineae bacterium]|nr:LysM peptidoglycan-binding domain-containing protein [Anaerolineae bacterium]